MKRIEIKEVREIARLAELEFSDKELKEIIPRLDDVLDHVANVSAADTENVKPTSHVIEIKNVFRQDQRKESLSREDVFKNAPDRQEDGFKIPDSDEN